MENRNWPYQDFEGKNFEYRVNSSEVEVQLILSFVSLVLHVLCVCVTLAKNVSLITKLYVTDVVEGVASSIIALAWND